MPDDLGPVPNYNLFEAAGILVPSLPLLLLLLPASFHKLTRILVLHNLMGFPLALAVYLPASARDPCRCIDCSSVGNFAQSLRNCSMSRTGSSAHRYHYLMFQCFIIQFISLPTGTGKPTSFSSDMAGITICAMTTMRTRFGIDCADIHCNG